MKIIINQPRSSYFVGGAEMISFDHASNFVKLGHDVTFVTINPKSIGLDYSEQYNNFYKKFSSIITFEEINQDESIKYIYKIRPGENRIRWNVESIYYNQKFYEFLNRVKVKFDLVFSYYILDSIFVPKDYVKNNMLYLCGIPKEQNDFQGSFLASYDEVLAISEEVKESWNKYFNNNIKVVSTGVDYKKFHKSFNNNLSKIRLLYVGRIIERKNVGLIVEAYEELKNIYNLSLTVVGDGPDLVNIQNRATDAAFTGVVENPQEYYKNSDIFVTPSKYGEGLQGTVLEAMSNGLTIVATNTKINKRLLSNGRGFLVDPNLESLKLGIIKAIKANKENIYKKNTEFIVKNYNWENKCKEILENLK